MLNRAQSSTRRRKKLVCIISMQSRPSLKLYPNKGHFVLLLIILVPCIIILLFAGNIWMSLLDLVILLAISGLQLKRFNHLNIEREFFETCVLSKKTRYYWRQVQIFGLTKQTIGHGGKVVMPYFILKDQSPANGPIIMGTYGMQADEFVAMMNGYLRQFSN